MKYQSRGLNFTIEELEEQNQKIFDAKYIAMQDLTEDQKNNPNYLREVHVGDSLEEIKKQIDETKGFYE